MNESTGWTIIKVVTRGILEVTFEKKDNVFVTSDGEIPVSYRFNSNDPSLQFTYPIDGVLGIDVFDSPHDACNAAIVRLEADIKKAERTIAKRQARIAQIDKWKEALESEQSVKP